MYMHSVVLCGRGILLLLFFLLCILFSLYTPTHNLTPQLQLSHKQNGWKKKEKKEKKDKR